ncbi:hypothetical protein [Streptomyces tanashiensis]|uniref:Uncharacterized protein n=1 Tax=Streptomyces tanashiensis TaxID=67367 RepID=A0ABY6RAS9_9ACTN|nr:hypothetical protein [Streptomyces tanashiensis]UZX26337.1 hypothetical protein LDH80_39435 [Streptomyces tanashiensis]
MKRKTPQEKKRLSYVKDHRNNYGENDKSSRRNIRRNKQFPNSANRRRAQTTLAALLGSPDDLRADAVEERMNGRRPKRWQKFPDAPLGAIVDSTLQRRAKMGTAEAESAAARLRIVRSRFDWMAPSDNPLLPPFIVRRVRSSLAEDDETGCA